MQLHLLFDFLAYVVGAWLSLSLFKSPLSKHPFYYYFFSILGFVAGALFFGSLNAYISLGEWVVSKSLIGALFGGIVAVESVKKFYGIKGSTGAYFVPSLAAGIMIGRIGCFFGGLEDYTYGVETDFFLGYDFGDGVLRHPVQLYESFLMGLFLWFAIKMYHINRTFFEEKIFYIFILYYAMERFLLEFLKPYADILYGLNLFQVMAIIMIGYSLYYLRRKR
jgi:prolipoprotein diacylglyceryltransferase